MDYKALEEHIKRFCNGRTGETGLSQRSDPAVLSCGHVK